MSKKWTTFLVAAAIGALLLPTAVLADCRVDVITTLAAVDSTTPHTTTPATNTPTTWIGDPVPMPVGDNVVQLTPAANNVVPLLNAEGLFERTADILVTDDAAGTGPCFGAVNNSLTFSITGAMTAPQPGAGIPAAISNIDVYDSNGIGGLGVTASSSVALGGGNTQQTLITVVVSHAGTAGDLLATCTPGTSGCVGAGYRIKNLRFDATSIPNVNAVLSAQIANIGTGGAFAIAAGHPATANSSVGAATATLAATGGTIQAGTTAGIGAGPATGVQNSGSGLTGGYAVLPNLQETAAFNSFRLAGAACSTGVSGSVSYANAKAVDTCVSGVANDVATVATSLVFAITGVPSGVTVTFPSTITTSAAAAGGASLTWTSTARGGSPLAFTGSSSSGSDVQVYDTTTNTAGAFGTGINIESADTADPGTPVGNSVIGTTNPNCKFSSSGAARTNNVFDTVGVTGNCDPNPKIGVFVGNPSGQGTANMRFSFGRGSSARFTGDDVAASGVYPAYTSSARDVVSSSSSRNGFFTITPTRTTLLFPYVTTAGNFNTGLAVVNTCQDTGVFLSGGVATTKPTCTTAGAITFYFVGVNAATGAAYSASLSTDLSNGGVTIPAASCPQANLDSNGRLVAGKAFACGASALIGLVSGAPAQFTGYVMAVLQANNGHGFSAQFNALQAPYAANSALVIESGNGGRVKFAAGVDGGLGQ